MEKSQWIGFKDESGRIIIKFTSLLKTNEVKIHCNYDDLDLLQTPVECSEFFSSPEKLVTVYQKVVTRNESYQYDAMGNRTTERILLRKEYGYTYEYYPNSNWLKAKIKQDGTERIDYKYDDNGNLTAKTITRGDKVDRWDYVYDLFNQMEQVKKNGQVVSSYIYDPSGFRVEKVGSKGKVNYVPLLNGEVGYRKEINKGQEYSFIYVGGQHLARVNGVVGGSGKKFYYQNDHLGSALAITDELGNKVVERDFTPFGEKIKLEEMDGEDPDEDGSAFTGKDWDEDVGLYYYNARWYDPEIGRFISEDPVGDDPTLYIYGFNNPLKFVDPTGKEGNVVWNWGKGLKNLLASKIPILGDIMLGMDAFDLMIGPNLSGPAPNTESNFYIAEFKHNTYARESLLPIGVKKVNQQSNFYTKEYKHNIKVRMDSSLRNTDAAKRVTPYMTSEVGNRSAAEYNAVIDQFDIENNPRYASRNGNTYCNIYGWDVTSAMNAEIPHWVDANGVPCAPNAKGAHELNANLVVKWLKDNGKDYGWYEVKTMEEAQLAADMGKPTVVVWYNNQNKDGVMDNKNPWSHDWDLPGHIAVVCPIVDNISKYGVYITQAGGHNSRYEGLEGGFGSWKIKQTEYFRFYVHE